MATFRGRLPSRQDSLQVFAICAFPIFVWAIIGILRHLPAWILYMSLWELVGTIAFSLAFALLETTIIFALLWAVAVVLPASLLRVRFVVQATVFILISAVWVAVLHGLNLIDTLDPLQLALWGGSYLIVLVAALVLILRSSQAQQSVKALVERLVVLSFIYVALGGFSVIIVLIRII